MKQFIEKIEKSIGENPIEKVLKWFLIPTFLGVLLIILIFLSYFSKQNVSTDISLWGTFGDFFGGILNPFISLISLLLIAFLTIFITSKENQKQFYLEKKIEAYGELMNYFTKLKFIEQSVFKEIAVINSLEGDELKTKVIIAHKAKIINGINFFDEFDAYIKVFSIKYDHIFDYDFNNKEFTKLVDDSFRVNSVLEAVKGHLENNDLKIELVKDFEEPFYTRLKVFVQRLKEEVAPNSRKNKSKLPKQAEK